MKYVNPTRHKVWRNTLVVCDNSKTKTSSCFYRFLFCDFVHVLYKFGGHMTLMISPHYVPNICLFVILQNS